MKLWKRIFLSVLTGVAVTGIPLALDRLRWPQSGPDWWYITWFPGLLCASVIAPQGIHSDGLRAYWYIPLAAFFNVVMYSLVAFAIFKVSLKGR